MGKDLRVLIAEFLQKINQHEGAIGLLERARASSPRKIDILAALMQLYHLTEKDQQLLEIIQEIENLHPDNLEHKWWGSRILIAINQYKSALQYLRHLESKMTFNDQGHALLGVVLLNLEHWEEAENNLRSALEIAPWNADACKGMVDLLFRTARFDEIYPFLAQHIQKSPDQYPGYVFMADHIYEGRFDPKGSLEWYQRGLELTNYRHALEYQKLYLACNNLFDGLLDRYVRALIDSGENDKALTLIQTDRKNRPDKTVPISRLADYHIKLGNYTTAETLARKTTKNRRFSSSWSLLAWALAKQGRFSEAIQNAEITIGKYPTAFAWSVLGNIYIEMEDWNGAINSFHKVLAYSAYDLEGLEKIGYGYSQTGQLDQALEAYETLVKISPLNADAWVELGEVYNKVGRVGDSVAALERALTFERLPEERKQEALALLATVKRDASQ
ncbi:MAG: tetratricopeptide repeat protein [Chloroflexota bacterium]